MCKTCEQVDLGFTSEKFPRGTHMCYIYDDDNERRAIISKFIESGLKENEKVAYFAHSMEKSDMIDLLKNEGIDLPDETAENLFVANSGDTYCPTGAFVMEDMVKNLTSFYQGTIAEGYPGARVSGEMEWVLEGKPGTERLMEYESLGDIVLKPNPLTIVCQYDARKFDGATLLNCLKVHPYMIVRGQIVRNPYYMSHEEFMADSNKHG